MRLYKLVYGLAIVVALASCSKSNDPSATLPKISVNDSTAKEGNLVTFTVTLSSISTDTVKFSYLTQNVTTTDDDYYAVPSKLTVKINPGKTTAQIVILTKTDALTETDETFKLLLSDPKNCVIGDGEGVGTITNVAAVTYFLKCKINGVQWNAIIGGFFGAEIIGMTLPAYGTDNDSQLSFVFYQDPTGPKTYGMEVLGATSDANLSVYYTPHFFTSGGLGTTWNGQPGGTFKITSFDKTNKIAEGTFAFTGKASDNTTVAVTEGSFKIPINQ